MLNTCLYQFVEIKQIPSLNRIIRKINKILASASVTWQSKQNVREGITWTYECRCGECVRASECVSCVPGGVRGSFEDHGEGGPDVLRSRRGNEGEHVCPFENQESCTVRASPPAGGAPTNSLYSRNPLSSQHHLQRSPMKHPPPSVVLTWLTLQLVKR